LHAFDFSWIFPAAWLHCEIVHPESPQVNSGNSGISCDHARPIGQAAKYSDSHRQIRWKPCFKSLILLIVFAPQP
jgi:hypothetical protein